MATSGSVDFNPSVNDQIERSLRLCGVGTRGEPLAAEDVAEAKFAAEQLIKHWQAHGIHLWAYGEATLFLTPGTALYSLGPGGANATESYTETALKVAASATDTTIDVDSIAGIADGDNIGIVLDNDTFHWTTVNGAPAGDTITLTDAMPSAAAIGNAVYAYTTKIDRPLRIHNVRLEIEGQDTPMNKWSRQQYFDQPNKTTQGRPTQWYYDPQLSLGVLYLWQTPDTVNNLVNFNIERPLQDIDSKSNTNYLPTEWGEVFVFTLAHRISFEYGVSAQKRSELKREANEALALVMGWDREDAEVNLQPDLRY